MENFLLEEERIGTINDFKFFNDNFLRDVLRSRRLEYIIFIVGLFIFIPSRMEFRNVGTKFRKHKLHEFSLSRQDIANAILPVIGERAKQPIIGNTYLDMYATGGTQMLQYLTPILFLKVTRYYVSYELFIRVSRIQHQFSLNYEITTETIIIVFYKFPIIRVTRNEKFKIKI